MSMMRVVAALCGGLWMGASCAMAAPAADPAQGAHQFTFLTLDGELLPLKQYHGKLLLVVNTASQCGFTPQYEGLEALYKKYKDRGLVILGVPSNDFGAQEPGTPEEIKAFTQEKYKLTFPLASKEKVSGKGAHPFYLWASQQAGPLGAPKWNFHKFLIGPNGEFIDWYASTTGPSSGRLIRAIEDHLPQK